MKENQLMFNPEKCYFEQPEIEFCRVIIRNRHVQMDPVKVKAVAEWPVLKSKKELQSYLRFCNFY